MKFSSLLAVLAPLALVAAFPSPVMAQASDEQQLGHVHFDTSCNETAQRRFDRAMRYQHSFWYQRVEGDFRGDAEGRSRLRHRLLGHRARPARTIRTTRRPRRTCRSALAAIQKAKAVGAKTSASATTSTRWRCMYVDYDKIAISARASSPTSRRWKRWPRNIPTTTRRRSSTRSRSTSSASPTDKTYANQLKGAAILEPIFKRQPQHPGRRALSHSPLRLSGDRGERARRRAALRQDRAGCAACAAHALAHLHARRLLEGIRSRPTSRPCTPPRPTRTSGDQLHGQDYLVYAYLQLARTRMPARVIDDMAAPPPAPSAFGALFRARRFAGALHGGTRRLERRGAASSAAEQVHPRHGDHAFRPRARRGALRQIRTPPRPTSPSSPNCATSCAPAKDAYGPQRSTSSARSRAPGSSTPKANTMRRSRR